MLQQLRELSQTGEKLLKIAETLNHTAEHLEEVELRHFQPKPPQDPPPLPDPVERTIFEE